MTSYISDREIFRNEVNGNHADWAFSAECLRDNIVSMLERNGKIYLEDVRSLIRGMVESRTTDAEKRKALYNHFFRKCAANLVTTEMPLRLGKILRKIITCVDIVSEEEKAKNHERKRPLNEQAFKDSLRNHSQWKSAIKEFKDEAAQYDVEPTVERKDIWCGQEVRLRFVSLETIQFLREQLIAKMVDKVEPNPTLQHRIYNHFHFLLENEKAKTLMPAQLEIIFHDIEQL